MTDTRWWHYLNALMNGDNYTEAAKKTGISTSNFTRWRKGARADPDFVVKVARAYDANILEALVEAEFITDEEAALTTIAPQLDLAQVDAQELLDELQHRIDAIRYLLELEEGGDRKLAAIIDRSNVVDIQSARSDIPHDAVADHSPEEEEGDPSDYDA